MSFRTFGNRLVEGPPWPLTDPTDTPSIAALLTALAPAANKAVYLDAAGAVQLEDRISSAAWTPGVTAGTPGDLTVAYGAISASVDKRGRGVDINFSMVFTPTYTTASGDFILTGLPFAADAASAVAPILFVSGSTFTWPNTATMLFLTPRPGLTTGVVTGAKSAGTVGNLAIGAFTTNTAYTLRFRGRYIAVT